MKALTLARIAEMSALLIGCALIAAVAAIWMTVRRRQLSLVAYLAIALIGCGIFYMVGSIPWVVAKALAISSPAMLTTALAGGGMLWGLWPRNRVAGFAE